jgi:hypothetical protein
VEERRRARKSGRGPRRKCLNRKLCQHQRWDEMWEQKNRNSNSTAQNNSRIDPGPAHHQKLTTRINHPPRPVPYSRVTSLIPASSSEGCPLPPQQHREVRLQAAWTPTRSRTLSSKQTQKNNPLSAQHHSSKQDRWAATASSLTRSHMRSEIRGQCPPWECLSHRACFSPGKLHILNTGYIQCKQGQ